MNALIVAAAFDPATQQRLDELRRTYFPPERNRLPAHLTLFHALPGDALAEVVDAVRQACSTPRPRAEVRSVRSLGRGAALVLDSPGLAAARGRVAAAFPGRLTRQDGQGFRPHVTVQNFVDPAVARATVAELTAGFAPWGFDVQGLDVHRYAGGPWELLESVAFEA
ncbi:2'-5' RNA ligase family protein [Kineococcus rhizosphaerae]|uniref:2'-5' RNA ligase superfamily protein n=1 Tax=Kineococcus rhizosphaerae TaxID=559628 RepID=A0A2T0R7D3_9ACTN|nr:2'-5' RNA ligase family protein [Kineococcus rhizosphaerae]PRY17053.1 2'-5' RNA ligase superfamily protein [Kineococcus rhizosphaerae]